MNKRFAKRGVSLLLTMAMTMSLFTAAGPVISAEETQEENTVRNLALRRAAYQSSAVNFDQTAQLVTDGIVHDIADEDKMAYSVSNPYDNEARYGNPKELFDDDNSTRWISYHTSSWAQIQVPFSQKKVIKSYTLTTDVEGEGNNPKDWIIQGSNDGEHFVDLDTRTGESFGSGETRTFEMADQTEAYTYYRLNVTANNGSDRIHIAGWKLLDKNGEEAFPDYDENVNNFVSFWMSEGNQDEWVYVDLGAESQIQNVKVYWGSMYATKFDVQVSDDAEHWTTVAKDVEGQSDMQKVTFDPAQGRYVRLLCRESSGDAYIVREMEVYGTNDFSYEGEVDSMPEPEDDGTQVLAGGNWKLERATEVDAAANDEADAQNENDASDALGEKLSQAGYDDSTWLPAVVPGTVLTSYLEAGAVPDPNYGDQQTLVSDSYFKSNFWYRNHFTIPQERQGERVWLNFEAINWKAEVYFNGHRIGNIEGAFTRAKFDVTEYVNYGGENYLAVLIYKNRDPGFAQLTTDDGPGTMGGVFGNDGSIGEDAPTYGNSLGWDWMPAVRGRNIGIYNDVCISYSQDVQVVDPWMITDLDVENKDFSKADLTLKTEVTNSKDEAVTATVTGVIQPSGITVSQEVELASGETKEITFDNIVLEDPELWWPNTYGDQFLYTATVSASVDGIQSDAKDFKFGVREFTYTTEPSDDVDQNGYQNNKNLTIYCNGTRIVCRGGNWGTEDINLDVSDEQYDARMRLHHDANMNMIRNWGGMTNDPAFYEACDKYGILVWDDYMFPGCWLHHPTDEDMFLQNAVDKVKNYRSHPSIVMYCGGNEMYPETQEMADGLLEISNELDGTRYYVPNSAKAPVSGGGPYSAKDPKFYFNNTAVTLRTERGLPNIPVVESMKAMFPEENQWPKNEMWALHDFSDNWNADADGYMDQVKEQYGDYNSLEDFVTSAQMLGYENHKAIFEAAFNANSNGMLLWMSQAAWPTLIWQMYDYYYDVNGGYYGIKTGNQPINFIWNPTNNQMVLYNQTANDETLKAVVEVYDLYGNQLYANSFVKDMPSDSKENLMELTYPSDTSDLKFIKTYVENAQGEVVAEDFYWTNTEEYQDYTSLQELPQVDVSAGVTREADQDGSQVYTVRLENTSDTPAVMLRLKVMNSETGERVLPSFYSDNYFTMMPGEVKEVTIDFKESALEGGQAQIEVEGFNVNHAVLGEETQDYIVDVVSFEKDGVAVGNVSAGSYVASAEVSAVQDVDANVTMAVAVYNDGKLVDVTATPYELNLKAGEKQTIAADSVTVPETEDLSKVTVKAYLLDGDSAAPLKATKEIGYKEIELAKLPVRNMAIGGKATASSGDGPEQAFDGSTQSRWSSDYADDQWIQVELVKETTISSIEMVWEAAYGKEYNVQVSSDGKNWTTIHSVTDGQGGTDKFEFDPISVKFVRVNLIKRGTDWGFSLYEVAVYEDQASAKPNLALYSNVTASDFDENSNTGDFVTPDKVVDGDMSTRWATVQDKDDQWMLIDLKEVKSFSSMDISWEAAYGSQYRIEVSQDGETYTPLAEMTDGKGGLNRFNFDTVEARYVKVIMEKRGTGWGYSIYEVALYE
ncbi:discoidin domain-containing protein [Solibaculum mannosilyticum]|uniref:discoidin domain-containing protein n=1 Tax=Solibaculum mannosilyticum TaxID=2780922 RepID=UPI0034C18BFF